MFHALVGQAVAELQFHLANTFFGLTKTQRWSLSNPKYLENMRILTSF
jgi:hypothetical protein